MVARQQSRPGPPGQPGVGEQPRAFTEALAGLRAATLRPEVHGEEMPAPQRIAPFAAALSADVTVEDDDVGTGRIVVLHDPAGNDAWQGRFRLVAYCRCEVDAETAADPLLGEVGWSWLHDALEAHGAGHVAASGSITRVTTESFGTMAGEPAAAQIEIRASWTPTTPAGEELTEGLLGVEGVEGVAAVIAAHVEAWGELLCTASGLEPLPEGVTSLPRRRAGVPLDVEGP